MTGVEFENFCAAALQVLGYTNVSLTKESGDQGADIIAVRDGVRIAFQCKFYGPGKTIGNKAVQEVLGGMAYYKCQKGIVITNSYFTKSAEALAKASNVDLWDGDTLGKIIDTTCAVIPDIYSSNIESVEDEIEREKRLNSI